jgi:hypothetical protein
MGHNRLITEPLLADLADLLEYVGAQEVTHYEQTLADHGNADHHIYTRVLRLQAWLDNKKGA